MLLPMKRRAMRQTEMKFRTWGGKRKGAGRKARPENVGLQPHCPRPLFEPKVPVHLTIRAVTRSPSLRSEIVAKMIVGEITRVSIKGFRVCHFSIQGNHVHLIAEADDGVALSRGMQRLASRIAMSLNQLTGRRGRLWRERYHRRDLSSPAQFRNALVYVVFNERKHAVGAERARCMARLDPRSSAAWVDIWATSIERPPRDGPSPVVFPQSWIASKGWRKHGLVRLDEQPVSAN